RRFAGLSLARRNEESLRRWRQDHLLHRLLYRLLSPEMGVWRGNPAGHEQPTLGACGEFELPNRCHPDRSVAQRAQWRALVLLADVWPPRASPARTTASGPT